MEHARWAISSHSSEFEMCLAKQAFKKEWNPSILPLEFS